MPLDRSDDSARVPRRTSRVLAVALLMLALVLLGVTGVVRVEISGEPPPPSVPTAQ